MINENVYRRFNHTAAACFIIYFLFPQKILGFERSFFILVFWLTIVGLEYFRLRNSINIIGLRDYENQRLAGFVWFATGTCMILYLYEIGMFPQSLAIATIVMAAYTDPVIGEAKKHYGNYGSFAAGIICSFIIFQLILGSLFYSIIGSFVAVIAEKPRLKWFDDDLAMQVFPITILTIISLIEGAPDLSQTLIEENP
tara:strand:+ start:368 stop:961 length:594 start_codon:yes stop_codon:yes gene_type:complete